jgi:hypothetical protein
MGKGTTTPVLTVYKHDLRFIIPICSGVILGGVALIIDRENSDSRAKKIANVRNRFCRLIPF